jgi:hypothetical protein
MHRRPLQLCLSWRLRLGLLTGGSLRNRIGPWIRVLLLLDLPSLFVHLLQLLDHFRRRFPGGRIQTGPRGYDLGLNFDLRRRNHFCAIRGLRGWCSFCFGGIHRGRSRFSSRRHRHAGAGRLPDRSARVQSGRGPGTLGSNQQRYALDCLRICV